MIATVLDHGFKTQDYRCERTVYAAGAMMGMLSQGRALSRPGNTPAPSPAVALHLAPY